MRLCFISTLHDFFVIELFLKIHGKYISTLSINSCCGEVGQEACLFGGTLRVKGNEHLIMSAECQSCQTGAPHDPSVAALTILLLWLSLTYQ